MLANNDDFISVSKQVYLSEDVFTYHLTYEYVNLGGSKDEFAILDNVQLSSSQPNSVFENINDVDVIVYPNPVVDKLNIENSSFKINSISIFNFEGKEVFNIIETNEESKEIDLGHLKSGIYYLKLKNKKQHKTIKFNHCCPIKIKKRKKTLNPPYITRDKRIIKKEPPNHQREQVDRMFL